MEGSMSEYQLEIKQIVDYPRCRIYRQFIQNLMADGSIRAGGGSGILFAHHGRALTDESPEHARIAGNV